MGLTKYEQETAINFNQEDSYASVYTCSKAWVTKLDKFVKKYPDTYKIKRKIFCENEVVGKEYILPKKLISVRAPSKKIMSEKDKKIVSERLKKSKMNKESKNK